MHYRTFQGQKISEIGLGTWQLGNADWGVIKKEDAFAILNEFVNAGGNFIDTADVYGNGTSEKLIGEFLKTTTREIFVATKLGRRSDEGNGWPVNFSYDAMRRHVERSLNNLGVSQLFLEQLHCIPLEEMKTGKVFGSLKKLQEEGLVKYFGASVESSEEALICLEQEGLASLQIIFNLFRQHVADEVFAKAKEKGVAIIVRVPLASGLLTGRFNESTAFPASDHRTYNANGEAFNTGETFSGIEFSKGVKLAKELGALLPPGPMAQWALRWILDHPGVTTIIPGASSVEQVLSNVRSSGLSHLSPEVHRQLRGIYEQQIRKMIRGHY